MYRPEEGWRHASITEYMSSMFETLSSPASPTYQKKILEINVKRLNKKNIIKSKAHSRKGTQHPTRSYQRLGLVLIQQQ